MAVELRVGIGHNGGPPLDVSWSAWLWRRAHAAAWKTPPREIAMLRIRRAERLGLSYRDYTAVLLDRGVHMDVIVFAPGALDAARPGEAAAKLAALGDCRVLLCLARQGPVDAAIRERAEAVAVVGADGKELVAAIGRFLRQAKLPSSAAFMVGNEAWHERAAVEAGLSLFKPATDYFSSTATR